MSSNLQAVAIKPSVAASLFYMRQPFVPASFVAEGPLSTQFRAEQEPALSEATLKIWKKIANLRIPTRPSMFEAVAQSKGIKEMLFDATAEVKVLTSRVAMYLEPTWRNKLFAQIDSLHDADEWEHGDKPLQRDSFVTFLKAICDIKPERRPGLGLTHNGRLIAAWTKGASRLTIEFHPGNRVRWVISRTVDNESEQFAGDTNVSRLRTSLQPYKPEEWFAA